MVPCTLNVDNPCARVGVTDYIMLYYWREFNLAIFYDSPNRQIKVLAKFSRYTVVLLCMCSVTVYSSAIFLQTAMQRPCTVSIQLNN